MSPEDSEALLKGSREIEETKTSWWLLGNGALLLVCVAALLWGVLSLFSLATR